MNANYQKAENAITELAKENFTLYPEDYPIENGLVTNEASENVSGLAENYWNNRTELDIKRDEEGGVTLIDYVEWCQAAFSAILQD